MQVTHMHSRLRHDVKLGQNEVKFWEISHFVGWKFALRNIFGIGLRFDKSSFRRYG